jgi:hypothetical protein
MTILGLLSAIAGFVKVRYLIDKAVIDNAIFRCHYRVTSAILFVCCILCTANSLIGGYIHELLGLIQMRGASPNSVNSFRQMLAYWCETVHDHSFNVCTAS